MQVNEKLDFSFSTEDFKAVDELFISYLADRKNIYNNLFKDNDYSEEEKKDYINFFIMKINKDEDQHPYLPHIITFLNRKYEFFTLPEIDILVQKLKKSFSIDFDKYHLQDESDTLSAIESDWEELKDKIIHFPLLVLDTYNRKRFGSCSLFYKDDTTEFVLTSVIAFISHIVKTFPNEVARLDSFILCSPEYISFSAGKNTFAYYIEDSVFLKDVIEEKDKKFYIETLYHEFGHFLFELMTQHNQIKWYDLYDLWESKEVKMSREEGKNNPEELFADSFSILMTNVHDYLDPNLNPIILQYCKLFLKEEFSVIF